MRGQALRADMLRPFAGCSVVAALFGGQALIGLAATRHEPTAHIALTVLLFTSLAISITVQVLADPLAGILDRLAFSKSPTLRADRAALRHTGAALPLRSVDPWPMSTRTRLSGLPAGRWAYNSLYFPYVVGVRAYAQNATASGLDPTARLAWQWLVTEVPQRSLHNWQNAAARLIAADLRGRVAASSD